MEGYDGKLKINTEIITKEAENSLATLEKRIVSIADILNNSGKGKGGFFSNLERYGAKLSDLISRLKAANNSTGRMNTPFGGSGNSTSEDIKQTGENAKKSGLSVDAFGKKIFNLMKGVIVAKLLTKAFRAMLSGVMQSFNEYVKYDKATGESFNNLKTSLTGLQNEFVSAFMPIVNIVLPYLKQFVDWLTTAANYVGQFIAALTGANKYKKLTTATQNYAKSVGKLGKATKETNKSLAAFDKLNNTDDSKAASSSGGAGGGSNATTGKIVESDIDPKVLDFLDKFKEKVGDLKEAWNDFLDWGYFDWLNGEIDLAIDGWSGYFDWLGGEIDLAKDGWSGYFDWLGGEIEFFKEGWQYLADDFTSTIENSWEGWKYGWRVVFDTAKSTFNNIKDTATNFKNNISTIFTNIKTAITDKFNGVKTNATNAFNTLKTNIKNALDKTGVTKWIDNFKTAFTGVKNHIYNTLNSLPAFVKKPINGFIDVINKMIASIEKGINGAVKGLNALKFTIPSWVGSPYGGKTYSLGLKSQSLPRVPKLAQGGYVNAGATLAQIGEAGREVVLPLDRNTEWADLVAERIGANNNEVVAELKRENEYLKQIAAKPFGISSREAYKAVQKEAREQFGRTGNSGLAFN